MQQNLIKCYKSSSTIINVEKSFQNFIDTSKVKSIFSERLFTIKELQDYHINLKVISIIIIMIDFFIWFSMGNEVLIFKKLATKRNKENKDATKEQHDCNKSK